jgi:hypothetical protein
MRGHQLPPLMISGGVSATTGSCATGNDGGGGGGGSSEILSFVRRTSYSTVTGRRKQE